MQNTRTLPTPAAPLTAGVLDLTNTRRSTDLADALAAVTSATGRIRPADLAAGNPGGRIRPAVRPCAG